MAPSSAPLFKPWNFPCFLPLHLLWCPIHYQVQIYLGPVLFPLNPMLHACPSHCHCHCLMHNLDIQLYSTKSLCFPPSQVIFHTKPITISHSHKLDHISLLLTPSSDFPLHLAENPNSTSWFTGLAHLAPSVITQMLYSLTFIWLRTSLLSPIIQASYSLYILSIISESPTQHAFRVTYLYVISD